MDSTPNKETFAKPYVKPLIVAELDLETCAGSPLGLPEGLNEFEP